jgi:hypothetical protein
VSIVAGQWVSKDAALRQCNRISSPRMMRGFCLRLFCERPAYVAGAAGRLIDFWVDRGRHANFWVLGSAKPETDGLPSILHGVAVRRLRRADLIAAETRVKNWSQIVPYLISFAAEYKSATAARNTCSSG